MPIIQAPEMQVIDRKHALFDHLKQHYRLRSDAALAHVLGISTPELSRFRARHKRPTAKLILAVYDAYKIPIETIRSML